MATEEARAMLDALMGLDRNAPLPPGAAIPSLKKKRRTAANGGDNDENDDEALLLPGHLASRSCYDKDIDPLYTAWGVDVYDLFVNTKSDIGTNPYIVDNGAHKQYQSLPESERLQLGYEYFLFQKLTELVRSCDRTIQRNQHKLAQEIARNQQQQRTNNRPAAAQDIGVTDVDPVALEKLAEGMVEYEFLTLLVQDELLPKLDIIQQQEDASKQQLEPILRRKFGTAKKAVPKEGEVELQEEENLVKNDISDDAPSEQVGSDGDSNEKESAEAVPNAEKDMDDAGPKENVTTDPQDAVDQSSNPQDDTIIEMEDNTRHEDDEINASKLQIELGRLTLEKQRVVSEISSIIVRLSPLYETLERQHASLNYVKSDITTDKTVCPVSGNFMSSRDADERIAAHYAGKQYQGWKLVRDKLSELQQQYGRYGPPPPKQQSSPHAPPTFAPQGGRGGPPPRNTGAYGDAGRGFHRGGGDDRYMAPRRDDGGYHSRGGGMGGDRWERGGGRGRGDNSGYHGGGGWRR
jgi:LUC7 N_terminus